MVYLKAYVTNAMIMLHGINNGSMKAKKQKNELNILSLFCVCVCVSFIN